jgi:hypothetical protein
MTKPLTINPNGSMIFRCCWPNSTGCMWLGCWMSALLLTATGLSLGQVVSVWLAFILSEANHRMNHVKPWAERRLPVLAACLGTEVRAYSSKLSCMILDLV